MINVQFHLNNGKSVTMYDVHPLSQQIPLPIPLDAVRFTIWLGTRSQPAAGDRAAVATFTCPRCQSVSAHPKDIEEGYCGRCHDWTRDS